MAKSTGTLVGHLTRKEQVILGLTLNASRGKPQEDGQREARRRKREAFDQLGLKWVADRIDKRGNDPAAKGLPLFTPDEMSDAAEKFEASRSSIEWALEQLDRMPPIGADDFTIGEIEERLCAIRAGDYRLPAELAQPIAAVPPPPTTP